MPMEESNRDMSEKSILTSIAGPIGQLIGKYIKGDNTSAT